MENTTAGPSQPISISGTTPGQLDPSQATRLLSSPHSKLSFATFHPLTASQTTRKLSSRDEINSRKRVVIETLPSGESYFRWVPRAKRVDNAGDDEGEWPRVIDICGQQVLCSQDQWDIYKLDPEYDCIIRPAPHLTTIIRREVKEKTSDEFTRHGKRHYVEDSSDDDLPMPGNLKRPRPAAAESDVDSDEEVEMIVDNTDKVDKAACRRKSHEKRKKHGPRPAAQHGRPIPTAGPTGPSTVDDLQDLSMTDLTILDPPQQPNGSAAPHNGSNSQPSTSQPPSFQAQSSSESPRSSSDSAEAHNQPSSSASSVPPPGQDKEDPSHPSSLHYKRANESSSEFPAPKRMRRTRSDAREELSKKAQDKKRFRQGRFNERLAKMREERDKAFHDALRASVPPDAFKAPPSAPTGTTDENRRPTEKAEAEPSPVEDPISLEEKIRRIQEINAYEAARREREEAQRKAQAAEAERKRKQEEAEKRERERVKREKLQRERDEERRRKQQEEAEARWRRKQQEEAERLRKQQEERYTYGPWTTHRALERYKTLAETFDSAQFSAENPITFSTVPWPVLHKPADLSFEDVDWSSVEEFFKAVRTHMRSQDYKVFIEKSHRRFHPDRWRARRVLQSVEDEEVRACLEVAANTVAQAITPLWREVKGN